MKHLSFTRARTARSLVAVAALALVVPAGASADIPITSFKAGPVPTYNHPSGLPLTSLPSFDDSCAYGAFPTYNTALPDTPLTLNTQAGANSDFCVAFRLGTGDAVTGEDLKDSLVELPVGTLAEIDNAAKCTPEEFARESTALSNCPTSSQIGTAQAQLEVAPTFIAPGPPPVPNPGNVRVIQNAPGRIFALSTPNDKAALLGVALVGSNPPGSAETKFLINVSQQGSPTVGLLNQTDTLSNVLAQQQNSPIAIRANALRFWGKAAEHPHVGNKGGALATPAANFFRLGTTCQTPQVTKLTINPYTDVNTSSKSTSASSAAYNLTGCEKLPFNPTFNAALSGETNPGGHPGLSIQIKSPEGDQDLGGTKITLPIGIATDLSRIQNACPAATFEADQCGSATIIGAVKATLSGINADVVSGVVHMVKVEGKTLPALGFDFNGRLPLRIAGTTEIDPAGRIVNTFANLPSIPQRSLDVELFGGSRGILQLPNSTKCTVSAFDAVLTSQNGVGRAIALPTKCGEQFKASIKKGSSSRPTLYISGAGATGKKVNSIRVKLPSGITFRANTIRSKSKIDKLEDAVTGRTTRSRLDKKTVRFTIPKPGSNGLRIMTRTGAVAASKKFTERDNALTIELRLVYTDGTKATVKVPLDRK